MRLALGLWLVTATLGIVTYARWYLADHMTDRPLPSADGLSQQVPLQGFEFHPKALIVMAGTTVTWVNHDTLPHTVTFDDGSVDSGSLLEGDTFSHTFDAAGTYGIYCKFHGGPGGAGMAMTVTVVESLEQIPTAATSVPIVPKVTAAGPMETGTPAPSATEAAPAALGTVAIVMQDYVFKPDAITIKVETTVTWTNKDIEGHTVTSDDGSIESGNIDPDGTYRYTFDAPGTYPLYCRYHGGPGGLGMHMTVTVVK
jgi:plastocyanin